MPSDIIPSQLIPWLHEARSVVVFTGAGMSAESGIPTFRDVNSGLWARYSMRDLSTPQAFLADRSLVWGWYVWRMATMRAALPNAGHLALAEIALRGLLPSLKLVTQNIDDLHERAGSTDVVHLHGNIHQPICHVCRKPHLGFEPPADAADSPSLRLTPPACEFCGDDVRPGVVWFGERPPKLEWAQAEQAACQCDLLIAVGTSGVVFPAALLPPIAKHCGARFVEINPVKSDLSSEADLVWRTTASRGLTALREELLAGSTGADT